MCFNQDILDYMRRQHNLLIGERSAEKIKIEVGAALPNWKTRRLITKSAAAT